MKRSRSKLHTKMMLGCGIGLSMVSQQMAIAYPITSIKIESSTHGSFHPVNAPSEVENAESNSSEFEIQSPPPQATGLTIPEIDQDENQENRLNTPPLLQQPSLNP